MWPLVQPPPTVWAGPSPGRPRKRRHAALDDFLPDFLPDFLLETQDPAGLRAHRNALVEKLAPQCEYDHFIAGLSACNTWLARRFIRFEASLIEAKNLLQADELDKQLEACGRYSRASYTFTDLPFLQSMRYLRDTESICLRRAQFLNRELRTPPAK